MSASREKKTRQVSDGVQTAGAQRRKHQEEEAKAHRSSMLYGAVIAIVAVAAVFILIWNSGMIQRNATAATINGEKYTTAELQYYYNSTANNIMNQYYSTVGMPPFDFRQSLKDQMFNEEENKTWHDYVMEQALENMTADRALFDKAQAEGFQLTEQTKQDKENLVKDLDSAWAAQGYSSRDQFIHANYGPYMTYEKFLELVDLRALAGDYAAAFAQELQAKEYTDADIQGFYKENADKLDSFTISQVIFQAKVDTVDENGEKIEMSEEEQKSALEEAKAVAKADAEEFKARLESGEELEALVREFDAKIMNSNLHQVRTGASVNSAYIDWAYDSARQFGDVTLAEFDGGSTFNYYVAQFDNRFLDQTKTANVRHALIAAEAEEGKDPTQEQYDAAKVKAEELLAQWQAGPATEDSFAEMASKNSADAGSAANGGLMTGVSKNSGYIPGFEDWCMDPARKPGDTGLVQNTGSATKGWHIMYYVADGEPVWKQITLNGLMDKEFTAWEDAATEGYEAQLGSGAKYVHN